MSTDNSSYFKSPADVPHTPAEKAWLKKHWKGEFHFLRAYQLSIYEEEDRAEGRAILHAMMEDEEEDEEQLEQEVDHPQATKRSTTTTMGKGSTTGTSEAGGSKP